MRLIHSQTKKSLKASLSLQQLMHVFILRLTPYHINLQVDDNSWKLLEPPGIEYTPGKPPLKIHKLTKTSGKPLEKSYIAVFP